tara:strand:- start:39 stop:395 length:357 start_codon:yes stop_codon:yes gene_type:complete
MSALLAGKPSGFYIMLLAYIYFAVSTTLVHLLNVNKLRYQRDNKLSMSDQYWDWHSLEFRHYCLLQQRRMDDAWKLDEHLESIVNGDDDLSDSFHVRQRLFFARYSRIVGEKISDTRS